MNSKDNNSNKTPNEENQD